MSLRRNLTTGEIREIPDEQIAAWLAAGNPKGAHYTTAWEAYTPPEPEPAVPSEVTRRQLFLWLNSIGITRAQVRGMLTTEAALIEFDEATTFARAHPLVAQLAAALGLTAEQVNEAFRNAATL